MYDDELVTSSQQASPAASPSEDVSATSSGSMVDSKDFPKSTAAMDKTALEASKHSSSSSTKSSSSKLPGNSSVDDILTKYYEKYSSSSSFSSSVAAPATEQQNQSQNNKKNIINDPQLFHQLSSVITKRAVQNREAVRKGVISFSKSTAYLTSQLSKGPLSDHDIKWMEVGLVANQPSPIRDSMFKIEEVLVDVGKTLEGIEAASERYAVAKKRREMLVEQRDKLLRIAAGAAASSNKNATTTRTGSSLSSRGESPEQQQ